MEEEAASSAFEPRAALHASNSPSRLNSPVLPPSRLISAPAYEKEGRNRDDEVEHGRGGGVGLFVVETEGFRLSRKKSQRVRSQKRENCIGRQYANTRVLPCFED
jgi:hypothetical protein